jgi:hypothetical protein
MTLHVDVTYGDVDPWYVFHVSPRNGQVEVQKALNSCDMCPHTTPLPRGIRHVINQTDGPHFSSLDLTTCVILALRGFGVGIIYCVLSLMET